MAEDRSPGLSFYDQPSHSHSNTGEWKQWLSVITD